MFFNIQDDDLVDKWCLVDGILYIDVSFICPATS